MHTIKKCRVMLSFLMTEYINYLESYAQEISLPFVYLFNHLSISIWIHGYLFFTNWVITQYNFIFVTQIIPTLANGCSFSWFLYTSDTSLFMWIFLFWVLLYILVLQDVLGPSFTFPVLVLESAISVRRSGSFYWRMVLETKSWAWGWI